MNNFELIKELEQKLQESGEKFRLLFDTIPDALYIIDQETGKILDVNKAAEKMYGYSREEWLQMKNTDVSAEPDKTKKATNKLPPQIPIRYHKKKDGTIFPIEMMISSYTLNDQKLIIATGRDITERKKLVEEEIKKHRDMIENLDIGYFSVDMNGLVTYANNAFKKIGGFSSTQELIGFKAPNFWVNPKDRQKYIKKLMADGFIQNYTINAQKKSGERISVEINAHLNRNANNEPIEIEGTFIDVTEKKKFEQNLKRQTKKVEILNKIILTANKAKNFDTMIREIFDLTLDLMDFDGGGVYIADYDNNVANLIYFRNLSHDFVDSIKECPLDIEPYKTLFYKAEPIFSENWHLNDPVFAEKSGLLSLAVIPILSKEEVIGALNVALKKRFVFSEEEKDILEYIGHEIGIIIAKMKMEEELKNHRDHLEQLVEARTKELGESEEKFRLAFENAADAIFWADPRSGLIINCNKMAETLLERKKEEIIGTHQSTLHPLDKKEYYTNMFEEYIKTKGYFKEDATIITKSGTITPVSIVASLTVISGEPIIQGSFRDMTARKKMEETLRESEEKWRSITEYSTDYIMKLDLDSNILFINHTIPSQTIEEVIGKLIYNFMLEKFHKPVKACFERVLQSGKPDVYYTDFTDPDGIISYFEARVGPMLKSGKIIGFTVSSTDITTRKIAEEKLRNAMENLKRSNAELEQFAYVVSHDLQEPLRMVASFTQLLQKRYQDKLDDEANEFINFAVDGATRMQGLINDLLTFSRVGTKGISFSPTDMNIILEDVLANIQKSTIDAEAEITYDPLPVIVADGSQMTQILQNLMSNAIKFRGKGPIHIHVSGENKPNKWVFSIRDNGIGIEPKNFERIFVIFQRLHKRDEYEGTGIGLAVCKKIIQRHGGKIWIESELGKGSTFYFSIPKKISKKFENNE